MDVKRNTIQRQAIFDSVRELNIHATAEQVYEHVVKKHPAISKATVYRNLGQMADTGELLNIGSFCGSVRYDHNCRSHYHFICERCKRVFDVNDYFPGLADNLTGMDGFEITGYILTFSGLCRECKEKTMR
jgi:Fe2+ or Zn2+ uptake regulation protein